MASERRLKYRVTPTVATPKHHAPSVDVGSRKRRSAGPVRPARSFSFGRPCLERVDDAAGRLVGLLGRGLLCIARGRRVTAERAGETATGRRLRGVVRRRRGLMRRRLRGMRSGLSLGGLLGERLLRGDIGSSLVGGGLLGGGLLGGELRGVVGGCSGRRRGR